MTSLQASQRDLAGQNEALEAVTRQLRSALVNKAGELQGIRQNMDQIYQILRYACIYESFLGLSILYSVETWVLLLGLPEPRLQPELFTSIELENDCPHVHISSTQFEIQHPSCREAEARLQKQ